MLMSLPHSYAETTAQDVMASGGQVFKGSLGFEGRALMNGVSALVRKRRG